MATSKQEQTYNEIIEYYAFADRLIRAVEDSNHKLAEQQFAIAEDIVTHLEECADRLTTQYIEFVKGGNADEAAEVVRVTLNSVMAKIEECRNKILMLYHEDAAKK